MAVNQTRYRQLQFIGADILEARELNWLQEMAQGVALEANGGGGVPINGQLQSLYRQGAMMNVTVSVNALQVTLSPTNGSLPMMIFVRDRWETFPTLNDVIADHTGTYVGTNHVITLSSSETTIYLSWQLLQQTGGLLGTDPTLSDPTTNQATANAGELQLALSTMSAVSGVTPGAYYGLSNTSSQLAVNLSLIPMLTFTNSGSALTYVPQDNVLTPALASSGTSGFVNIDATYGGTGSKVVATNDGRLGVAFPGTVTDSLVRSPIAAGGTNSNGTPVYKLPVDGGTDPGGISAAKIILLATTQTVEAGWNWLVGAYNSLYSAFYAHYIAPLGLANTHPLPTPAQVGAAPSSHVGQPLGTSGSAQAATSHPGVINTNTSGFQVNQSVTGAANDPAYGVFTSGSNIASLNHDGDIYSGKANAYVAAAGGGRSGNGVGPMGLMSAIASALTQHVNQVSNTNPHGTTAGSLGFVTAANSNGYLTIPTSTHTITLQWGIANANTEEITVCTFPTAFPTVCLAIVGGMNTSGLVDTDLITCGVGVLSRTQFQVTLGAISGVANKNVNWFAVGY